MNIFELAQKAITEKEHWSTESVKLWENKINTVYAKRNAVGQIHVFITTKESIKKNAKLANIQWFIGSPGSFTGSELKYQKWVKKVQQVM